MIESLATVPGCPQMRFVLHPPRALSGRQMGALFAVMSGAMWVAALLSAAQGNVFAPLFALLDSLIVAASLRWMWRLGERCEQIDVDRGAIRVRRWVGMTSMEEAPVFEAHPYWVRLSIGNAGREPHVMLASQGLRVEVGGFLAPEERKVLAGRLHDALQAASGRAGSSLVNDATNRERSE
ncbi:MAG TPA: DUF2244 domain-containing protein [Xanthomonadaceae bacterium]|jgi:uncharacterized membrane protein|nr:DUF2244 domain-containing protein [Xanthomonadaceae bacterium]